MIFKSWWTAAEFITPFGNKIPNTTKIYKQDTGIVIELDELTFDELFQVA